MERCFAGLRRDAVDCLLCAFDAGRCFVLAARDCGAKDSDASARMAVIGANERIFMIPEVAGRQSNFYSKLEWAVR